ncbi:unnamed protein product [Macrosiphum euphorbiae]|uniref:Uncharacterized protein n=1 Tax=Macrosiphum euphorbiae TaxID=13131 RepID=A0AAV0WAX1_9HEMI|nr:unnamed protein product [Macrosiphum euphorbiae]
MVKKNFILPTDKESSSKISVGRPKTNFNECAERTKINKVKHLVKSYTSPELSFAASAKYQLSGKRCESQLFKESVKSPNRAKQIMNSYTCVEDKKPIPYSIDEALALLVNNKLTKQQYVNIRISSKKTKL